MPFLQNDNVIQKLDNGIQYSLVLDLFMVCPVGGLVLSEEIIDIDGNLRDLFPRAKAPRYNTLPSRLCQLLLIEPLSNCL